ncbi:hypothetical protein PVAND_003698 [Polypedilum vanderplanki]|uniref:Chitin-binding type-2 domain-containing protein n=1 Tax=Polypedilum vanderplanki TaxID=319348 RepID=A0A9J6BVD8_POLVA|nr:hypothetical protein PVAND_003698 [Polypedilum vanderplanki]
MTGRIIFVIISLLNLILIKAQYPEVDEDICIGYEDGALFQIQGTCTLYYYCVDQIGYIDDCKNFGDEYQFDPEINDCNLAEIVGCVEEEEPFYPDPDPETNPPVTQAPPIVTTQPPTQTTSISNPNNVPDVECPTNKPNEILFFESLNCTEYYVCANGIKLTMRCMEGFVWNPDENQCDHPVYNPRCSNLSFDANRNVKCNRHGFYTAAYPSDCSKYVFCAEGIPMIQVCPIGTSWHIDRCVASQYALCHDTSRLRF